MAQRQAGMRIVIVGGGFAGAYCAQALERRLHGRDVEIVLLDRHNYFIFYPLLVEAGTGSLEPRHAVVSIRKFLRRTDFRMAEATGVDVERQRVTYRLVGGEEEQTVACDHLVLALGSVTRLPDVPGLREHGFQLKTMADAVGLRDRAIQLLELANATAEPQRRRALLHWVIVGANFSGVELAGEFHVFLRRAARFYPKVDPQECTVTLVELADRILPALDRDLADYAAEQLSRRGVRIELNNSVRTIEEDHAVWRDGRRIDTHTVVWCAGIAPSPLIARTGLPVDERGYILCERDLRVRGFERVWGIGDCAVNPGPDGRAYPATAQHAIREGAHLAENLGRVLEGRAALPCDIRSQGALAALGCRTAVANVMGFKLSGFPAWWLWRTVYLLKMPGWGRRLRIALDWTLNLLFARDYVQLGLRESPSARSAGAASSQAEAAALADEP